MNENKRDPIIRILGFTILILIAVAAVGITALRNGRPGEAEQSDPFPAESTPAIPTPAPEVAATEKPVELPTPPPTEPPTVELVPTVVPDYTFGVLSRDDSCELFTEIVTDIMSEELRLEVAIVEFPSPRLLFEAVAGDGADMTLCFSTSADKRAFVDHVGFVTVIDEPYFENESLRLQLLLDSRLEVPLQRQLPCLNNFLTDFMFTPEDATDSAETWIDSHRSTVEDWIDCE